jgi:acyl transferase domain-containing protein
MNRTVFLFSGEGTHSPDTRFTLLTHSPLWKRIEAIVQSRFDLDLEPLWHASIGHHRCPHSPLLTVISQICLSDLWRRWGFGPDVVVGHSTGELAAAYQAGFYSLEETLLLAYQIGTIAARLEGVMLHGWLPDAAIAQLPVHLASFNFKDQSGRHVTVSGYAEEMQRFHDGHPDFVQMKLPHPWHHPDYGRFADQLTPVQAKRVGDGSFVSGVSTAFETQLKVDHWQDWLVNPIDFIQTMQSLASRFGDDHLDIIEIGFHPILEKCCHIFGDYTYVSSMFRGQDDFKWIFHQRRKLGRKALRNQIKPVIDAYQADLDYGQALAYQGFNSLKFTELSVVLQPFFPSLAPHDFYRYKTIDQLIDRFGVEKPLELAAAGSYQRNGVVICAMSCRFPAAVETLSQFWEMLTGRTDQVRPASGRGQGAAGFLDSDVAAFDHGFFNIPSAEARTMDPQQALALELTEMLWRDAGIDPQTLDRRRIGVYLGVWSQEYGGDRNSVYYPTGTNPSIIASRISYQYDLRGPSWVSNTACSSSLVAIHYAAKDIEAGRVDYAIAGGVNMLLDEAFTANMRNSGFLSADDRCKAFDNSANGYVRAEGGGLVLLANRALADTYYAELSGSAVNQNGGRSQVITAPHPEAQEELIAAACQDAGITPDRIAYVECHGTGTKLGDPIELSALQNTVARNRSDTCYVGSVKSNIGHLESAAGVAGLIKSTIALNQGLIPPNLHFQQPNRHIDFTAYPIRVVTEPTPIDHEAAVGVSSFGFGGANAHIVLKGAPADRRKPIRSVEVPFDRQRAISLAAYLNLLEPQAAESGDQAPPSAADATVRDAVADLLLKLTGIEAIDPDLELLDHGLDSMSATEMARHLEARFKIEIDPDLLFDYPLFDQFVEAIEKQVAARKAAKEATTVTRDTVDQLVTDLFFQLTRIDAIDPAVELTDQGLDSMSGTELIAKLEASLNIELGPEILFEYPLRDQFVDQVYALAGRK